MLLDEPIHRNVDSAHEEAGDACHPAGIAALRDQMFEAREIGFDDLFIDLLREQQRNIDVDPLADELADRRQARLGPRHFDHQVIATDRPPEPPRFDDGRLGIHRQIGRNLEADVSVPAFRCFKDRAQGVGSVLNIFDRKSLIERHDIAITVGFNRVQGRIIVGAAGDGFFENRGVGGHACQPVLLDQFLQPALGDETPRQEVEPNGLPKIMQALERIQSRFGLMLNIHDVDSPLDFSICCFAAASTCAGVNPNFVSKSLSGADAPNVVMPILVPVAPT